MDANLYFSLLELQQQYVQSIDDGDLEAWPEFFTDACLYKIVPRENYDAGLPAALMNCGSKGMLVDRVTSLRHANIFNVHTTRHLVGAPRVLAQADGTISTETSYAVFQTQSDGETSVFQVGRYLDEVIRAGDKLLFRSKICVADTNRVNRLLSTPV
jgi:anthranilate 1,2-dioxygenase small subunit